MNEWNTTSVSLPLRGAFSYVKRVTQKLGKTEYAAKFVSTRAKKKTSALREMKLLSRLDHDRVLYFHDAFEKKNAVVIVTELYPFDATRGPCLSYKSFQSGALLCFKVWCWCDEPWSNILRCHEEMLDRFIRKSAITESDVSQTLGDCVVIFSSTDDFQSQVCVFVCLYRCVLVSDNCWREWITCIIKTLFTWTLRCGDLNLLFFTHTSVCILTVNVDIGV